MLAAVGANDDVVGNCVGADDGEFEGSSMGEKDGESVGSCVGVDDGADVGVLPAKTIATPCIVHC